MNNDKIYIKKIIQSQLGAIVEDEKKANILTMYRNVKKNKLDLMKINSAEVYEYTYEIDEYLSIKQMDKIVENLSEELLIEVVIIKKIENEHAEIYHFDGQTFYLISDKEQIPNIYKSMEYILIFFIDLEIISQIGGSLLFDALKQTGEFKSYLKDIVPSSHKQLKVGIHALARSFKLNINKVAILDVLEVL